MGGRAGGWWKRRATLQTLMCVQTFMFRNHRCQCPMPSHMSETPRFTNVSYPETTSGEGAERRPMRRRSEQKGERPNGRGRAA